MAGGFWKVVSCQPAADRARTTASVESRGPSRVKPPLLSSTRVQRTALTTTNPSDTIPIGNIPPCKSSPARPHPGCGRPAAGILHQDPSGTWRPPDDEERKQLATLREAGRLRRIKRLANALIEGVPVREYEENQHDHPCRV